MDVGVEILHSGVTIGWKFEFIRALLYDSALVMCRIKHDAQFKHRQGSSVLVDVLL